MSRYHVIVCGRVQGVSFRYATLGVARELQLCGWVRNRKSGDEVEVVVEGDEGAVAAFLDFLRVGPSGAEVSDVAIAREEPTGEYSDFHIAPTA